MARANGGRARDRQHSETTKCFTVLSLVAAVVILTVVMSGALADAAANQVQSAQANVREAILRMKAAHHTGTNPHEHLARTRTARPKDETKTSNEKKCTDGDGECNDKPPQNRADIVELRSRRGESETLTPLDATLLAEDAALIDALPTNLTSVAERIREATVEAWTAYRDHAWGKDELVPHGCSWENVYGGQGVTIIDAMSTLLLMDLNKEYEEAANWVKHELVYDKLLHRPVSTFETIIRSLGGLLSAFETTDDCGLLDKAADLGARILDSFSNQTSLMAGKMRLTGEPLKNALHHSPRGLHSSVSALAEVGTFSLEFAALAYHTGDTSYISRLDAAMDVIERTKMENGLFPVVFNTSKLKGVEQLSSIGAKGDSYYEYLLKRWIHSEVSLSVGDDDHRDVESDAGGQRRTRHLRKWIAAMDDIIEHMVKTNEEGYMYIGDYHDGSVLPRMEHLSCFVPGMLTLGVTYANMVDDVVMGAKRKETYLDVAKGVARTCFAMYMTSGSKGLSPEFVYFHPKMSVGTSGRPYLLRPEAIESFYYLFVNTGDEVYRAYAYHIFLNILRHHEETDKVSSDKDEKICGFSVVHDVTDDPNPASSTFKAMPSYFISETLKYLYLLFDDSAASFAMASGEFVLNTEGHPLRQLMSVTRDDATHPCKRARADMEAKTDIDQEDSEEVHASHEEEDHVHQFMDEQIGNEPSFNNNNTSAAVLPDEDIEEQNAPRPAVADADGNYYHNEDIDRVGNEHIDLHMDETFDEEDLEDADSLFTEEPHADNTDNMKPSSSALDDDEGHEETNTAVNNNDNESDDESNDIL